MSQALVEAAPLKPAIRLAQAISSFAASIDSAQQQATFKTLRSQSSPTAADVIRLTEEINRDGQRLHKAWRPYGTRLVCILERIRLFATAGDILVGGSQNLIASGVWAVVRMSLQAATEFLTYFDKISELFMRVGRASKIQQDTVALFPGCHELQEFMCEYLIVVVQFCQGIVTFTRQSLISRLKFSLGTSFDPECKTFEVAISLWSDLIDKKLRFLSTQSQVSTETAILKTSRALDLLTSTTARSIAFEERRLQVLRRLSPHQNQRDFDWRRQRRKGCTPWIFSEQTYLSWKNAPPIILDSAEIANRAKKRRLAPMTAWSFKRCLWVTGHIGSGKTVLMANIVADLCSIGSASPSNPPLVASYFFDRQKRDTLNAHCVIGSIAHQLVRGLDKHDNRKLFADLDKADQDPWKIIRILEEHLPETESYFVVLDAVDECDEDEVADILRLLNRNNVRLCCSSRSNSSYLKDITRRARLTPKVLSMNNEKKNKDMEEFIRVEVERRCASRNLDPLTADLLRQALVAGSQGMYLWVTLQLDALLPDYSRSTARRYDIANVLDSLPLGLQQSYHDAIRRTADHQTAKRAFQLAAASARPLTADEFRIALNVQPENIVWDPSTVVSDPWELVARVAGGLLEIDEETKTIHYIHHSALQYVIDDESRVLLDQARAPSRLISFGLGEANMTLARICVTYLNYDCFERQLIERNAVVVEGSEATKQVYSAAVSEAGSLGKLFSTFLRQRPAKSRAFDVTRLLREYQQSRLPVDEVWRFAEYAGDYWLYHTKGFDDGVEEATTRLFVKLLSAPGRHIKAPWIGNDMADALNWSIRNGHGGIFQAMMMTTSLTEFILAMDRAGPSHWAIKGKELGNVVARCVESTVAHGLIPPLLLQGADPNLTIRGSGVMTLTRAIYACSPRRNLALIENLIEFGALIEPPAPAPPTSDDCGHFHGRPLITAVDKDWDECVELLVRHGARLNTGEDGTRPTALGVALNLKVPETVPAHATMLECLLRLGANPNGAYRVWMEPNRSTSTTPLLYATETGQAAKVSLLLAQGADPNIMMDGYSPLQAAVAGNDAHIARLLLYCQASPVLYDSKIPWSTSPFLTAIRNLNTGMFTLLVEHVADVNDKMPERPLQVACAALRRWVGPPSWDKLEVIINTLLDKGAVSGGMFWPLPLMTEHFDETTVIAFMDAGANLAQNEHGDLWLETLEAANNRGMLAVYKRLTCHLSGNGVSKWEEESS